MNLSPWSYYGRRPAPSEPAQSETPADPALGGAVRDATRTREQLIEYLHRTLQEYSDIRGGRRGYQKLISDALKPAPGPESIEETLRRLNGDAPNSGASSSPDSAQR